MDDQERVLDEASAVVKEQAFYLKRATEKANTREALKYASNMISELRTSLLSPKNYYDLYSQVFAELQHLYAYFCDTAKHGRKMVDLYESVQHAGTIVPRLYLLATVGAAYIHSEEAPAKEILKDISELCKGVQDPLRGLFLRYYLSQMLKDKVPDVGTIYHGDGGEVDDAFDFLFTNLDESNRLWVRVQYSAHTKDKPRREKERQELRVLVGANLVRLGQLEGMTADYYAEKALQRFLDQVMGVKEAISQQYMLESLIQVFPDEYHMRTLETLLEGCGKSHANVDMKAVIVLLLNRLSRYMRDAEGDGDETDVFGLFRTHLQKLMEKKMESATKGDASGPSQGSKEIASCLEMQAAFMQFTLTMYPDQVRYVDQILSSTVQVMKKYVEVTGNPKVLGDGADRICDILSCPLKSFGLGILDMEHYTTLTEFLDFDTKKKVAVSLVEGIAEGNLKLSTVDAVNCLFKFIQPVVKDDSENPRPQKGDKFMIEQQSVARLAHQVENEDADMEFQIVMTMRGYFGRGGPNRMAITLPAIFFAAARLVPRIQAEDASGEEREEPRVVSPKKVFQFMHKTCTELQRVAPETSTKLWLAGAATGNTADKISPGGFEPICTEFFTQALINYEEEVSETHKQFSCLSSFVGTLYATTCLAEENFDMVSQKITQHAARLLRKPAQCRAVALCANLFWCPAKRDGKRVLECLQKCLKITDNLVSSDSTQVGLWVEMLDKYLYCFEVGIEEVGANFVRDLIALCKEQLAYAEKEPSSVDEAAKSKKHYNEILAHIRLVKIGKDTQAARRIALLDA